MILLGQHIQEAKATEFINGYINEFQNSSEYAMYVNGENYYISENTTIMNRKKQFYSPKIDESTNKIIDGTGELVTDYYRANNRIPSGFYKLLVDQKIQYTLGRPIQFGDDEEQLKKTIGEEYQDELKITGKESSKKCIGWQYIYTDESDKFSYKNIDPENFVPLYDPDNPSELGAGMHFYNISIVGKDGKVGLVKRIEYWDKEYVTYYQETDVGASQYRLCTEDEIGRPNPHSHIVNKITASKKQTTTDKQSWGKVPFVPLYNNYEQLYDLKPTRPNIDIYDIIKSDFANNLEDMQDVTHIIRGYGGENLDTFSRDLKKYRIVKLDEGDEYSTETIQVPYEARKVMLDITKNDIFNDGMGVDVKGITSGNITNVLIKSQYANLDLKADDFESQIRAYFKRFMYFVNKYREWHNEKPLEDLKLTFDRSLIINEVELLDANVNQTNNVSKQTQLENHRWISNANDEIKRMYEENKDNVIE